LKNLNILQWQRRIKEIKTLMFKSSIFVALLGCTAFFSFGQKHNVIAILIVDGFSNHDWKQTSALTKRMLEESGLFKVVITTVPTDSIEKETWKPEFEKYAVIIQNINNI
jgi:hypothetical protein